MRQVLNTIRKKQVYNMSMEEFKRGEWLKMIPNSELVEVQFKNHFLSVHDALIEKTHNENTTEMVNEEDEEDGRNKHKRS